MSERKYVVTAESGDEWWFGGCKLGERHITTPTGLKLVMGIDTPKEDAEIRAIADTLNTARADAERVRELEVDRKIVDRIIANECQDGSIPDWLSDWAESERATAALTRKPAQDTQSICDCGKIEHGRHHSACPVMQRKPAQDCALCRGVGKVNRCEGDTSVPVDCPKCKPAQEGAGV